MAQPPSAVTAELLAIIESLSLHPTSGELLGAFVRAERAGYERGLTEAANRGRTMEATASAFLRRQAG